MGIRTETGETAQAEQTQQTLLASTLLATGRKPRVLVTDTHFLIYFYSAVPYSALFLAQIAFSNPTGAPLISAVTSVGSGLSSTISSSAPNYDVATFYTTSSKTQDRKSTRLNSSHRT